MLPILLDYCLLTLTTVTYLLYRHVRQNVNIFMPRLALLAN